MARDLRFGKLRFGVSILVLLEAAAVQSAPARPSLDAAASQILGEDIAQHVKVLSSDAFEGRAPGTRGETLTLNYVERQFRRAALTPAYGNSFRQAVPLVEAEIGGTPQMSVASAGQEISLRNKDDFVAQLGAPVPHVDIRNAKMVFAGFGVTAPEFDWDDYSGVDVRGKVVVLLRGDPGTATGDAALFGGRNATIHSVLSEKVRNAAAHGALGVIFIHDDSAGYPWSVLAAGGLGKNQYFLAPEKKEPTVEATFWVSEPAGGRLLASAGLDLAAARKTAVSRGFRARELLGATVNMKVDATTKPIVSHNLVSLVPGASGRRECLYFLAHWDHMGRDPSLKGDQIFNGAVDNATGVGALIEIGRALKSLGQVPKRTIVLVATTAEERGLLGSEYLARHPICPIERTIGAVAIDALFPFGPDTHMTVTGFGNSELEDLLAVSATKFGRKLQDDGQPEAGANYRADHYRFLRRGVPGFLAVGGPANSVSEKDPQAVTLIDYVQHKYHRPSDEYDAKTWDMRGIEGDARILFDFAWRTANDPRVPNWYWNSPLRSRRDEMESRQ